MRNPRLWRNVSLVIAISGFIALALVLLVPEEAMAQTVRGPMLAIGLFAAGAGSIAAGIGHQAVRAKEALARGEDVLARWTVNAAALQVFAAGKHEYEEGPPPRYNEFNELEELPAEDLQVIVGKEAVQIGERIYVLARRGTPEVTFAGVYTGSSGELFAYMRLYYPPGGSTGASGAMRPARHTMLRFPVPPESLQAAQAAMAYYHAGRPGDPDFFHGAGDGTNAEDLSVCIACGYKTHAFKSHCPQCGAGLQSRRWSRRYGFVLVLCGLAISGIMAFVHYHLTPALLHTGDPSRAVRFNGTPAQGLMVFGILAMVTAFGLTALGYGAWQIATGRRSRWVIAVVVAMWMMFLLAAQLLG